MKLNINECWKQVDKYRRKLQNTTDMILLTFNINTFYFIDF